MKVSLNTIKQYIDFELPPVDELVKRINEQLGGVEEVIDLADKYKDAVIVKVVEAEKHPNADRLNVTKIDDGGKTPDVPRDENGLVQVVCGAPNVHADMFAVWLPPKATVPASWDDAEPFVLDARELRGVLSQGMLAAADELAIGPDHEGIIEITETDLLPASVRHSELDSESSEKNEDWIPDQVRDDVALQAGMNFAETFGLDDTIIDIENKMFTHRPDLFGQLGVAREIAGILGHKFVSPSWYLDTPTFSSESALPLEVFNDAGEKVPRVMFVAMKNIAIKPSPLWLQCALVAMGSKPINNIVDVTNYVMLLTAQPTHAYDYDKIRGARIGARMAKAGEKIHLLNDKTYELTADDIVIADAEGPIGLGGIMGGGDSEVDADTKNIILEVATFDMYTVRKSSMRHGVFTDALTRFNKGQSPLQNDHIMSLLMMSVKDVSSAEQASEVFDEHVIAQVDNRSCKTDHSFINDRLGLSLSADEMTTLLTNVEIKVDGDMNATPPFWRTDIELPEDVVEEVGRLYGFDKLPRELPTRSIRPAAENQRLLAKRKVRAALSRAGANEVLTYSFVHRNVIEKAGQNPDHAYQLGNALSPDLQLYRLSLLPSLLDKTYGNLRAGYDSFGLFEIGKAHMKGEVDEDGLPKEFDRIAAIFTAKKSPDDAGAPYYQARKYVMNLLSDFSLARSVKFEKLADCKYLDHPMFAELAAPFARERAAAVYIDDKLAGVVGEFTPSAAKNFKLPAHTSGFELFLSPFITEVKHGYAPLSRYPSVSQDISLKLKKSVTYQDVFDVAWQAAGLAQPENTVPTLGPIDIYAADGSDDKTITLRLTLTAMDRTLTDADVAPMLDAVAATAHDKFAAERV